MKGPGFWRGALVALALSVLGATAFALLSPLVGAGAGLRALLVGLAALYLGYLLRSSRARAGRLVTVAVWLGLVGVLAALDPPLGAWLAAQVGFVWLVRCLYVHDGLLAAAADAALNGLALAVALGTALHTRSLFLALW